MDSEVFLVSDNHSCLVSFRKTLLDHFPTASVKANGVSEFRKMSDSLVWNSKFIFVMPNSPRPIIYDKSHPARSFHKEIDKADVWGPEKDAVFIVVYRDCDPHRECLIDPGIERLYRVGTQIKLEEYATRSRMLSFNKSLNVSQLNQLSLFLGLTTREATESLLHNFGRKGCEWISKHWKIIIFFASVCILFVFAVLWFTKSVK